MSREYEPKPCTDTTPACVTCYQAQLRPLCSYGDEMFNNDLTENTGDVEIEAAETPIQPKGRGGGAASYFLTCVLANACNVCLFKPEEGKV